MARGDASYEKRLKDREARKTKNRREAQMNVTTRVSYVRKPLARNSLISTGLTLAAVGLFAAGFTKAIRAQGQAGLDVAAICFCSSLVAAFAIFYGVRAFAEKEKNYMLAKIGVGISSMLMGIWLVMIIIGLRG